MKKNFADILQNIAAADRRKYEAKLPFWASSGATVPTGLSLEQCSSEAAARYKAWLLLHGGRPEFVVDLTCGLGVDSWAFSQVTDRVRAYERNTELAEAARRNFSILGAGNIEVSCTEVNPETDIPCCDVIFADPARRDAAGRKVFLLEDCSPDIFSLLPSLCTRAPRILLKLSPMADITMVARRLESVLEGLPAPSMSLQEVHVTSLDGEVKELLCLIGRRGTAGTACTITVRELLGGEPFVFLPAEESGAEAAMLAGEEELFAAGYLIEPSAGILKAGAFKLPSARFGIRKADVMTQLYFADAETAGRLPERLFRAFPIKEILPFGKAAMKDAAHRYPHCEISVRNFPLSSEALRAKMGVSSGRDARIFAFSAFEKRWLAVT